MNACLLNQRHGCLCSRWSVSILSVDTRWKAFCDVFMFHHGRRSHKAEACWQREDLLCQVREWEGQIMIVWYSVTGSLHHAHELAHFVSFPHLFSGYHSSPWESRFQFLSRLIIALLASPCNGPILCNPDDWACALPMTKDYFIDHLPP